MDVSSMKRINLLKKAFGGLISCWNKVTPLILVKLLMLTSELSC